MKIIKFRAWLISERKMYDVGKIDMIDNLVSLIPYSYYRKRWSSFEECELMEYTGLDDKNGVEIYQGDIVLGKSLYFRSHKFCIEWDFFYGGAHEISDKGPGFNFSVYDPDELEVIGNKYQNTELLLKGE